MANRKSDEDLFFDSIRLIKKGMEVYYNFPKADILKDDVLMAWFKSMNGSGVKFGRQFCPDATVKPERPIKSNFYSNYATDDRCSIYLLEFDENVYNNIKEKRSILIGRPGEEMEIFKSLLEINERPGLMVKITSWTDYCPQIPLSDVIICDNHYFKNEQVYNANANELIKALASIPKDSLSIVIVTKEGEIDRCINLEEQCGAIKKMAMQVSSLSKKKCSVTIMTTRKLHSRHIITNYYRIAPTSCVHLKDNQLKADATITIDAHTDPKTLETTRDLIEVIQGIADNPVQIFGDKISNFLHFS